MQNPNLTAAAYLFLVLTFLLFFSCTSYGPSVGEGEKKRATPAISPQDHERIATCIEIAKEQDGLRVYQFIQEGSVAFEQTHHVRIDTLREGAGYRFREVYNMFASEEDESVEFYLSEFTLRTNDTGGHHASQDFRVIVKPDTAFLQLDEDGAFELDSQREFTLEDATYEVFRFLGHEHNHGGGFSEEHQDFSENNPPAFYQYWSPTWGTLYLRYGSGATLVLHNTEMPSDTVLIQSLIARIQKWDEE